MTFLKKLLAFTLVLPFVVTIYFLVLAFLFTLGAIAAVFAPTKVWYAVSKFIDRSSGNEKY